MDHKIQMNQLCNKTHRQTFFLLSKGINNLLQKIFLTII